jgi:hypothetical protein
MRRPPRLNSFHAFVPRGNSHASGLDLSIEVPGGSRSQRRFAEPSDQSGYCGVNAVALPSENPVSSSGRHEDECEEDEGAHVP